jgi:uncharacterized membrane protein
MTSTRPRPCHNAAIVPSTPRPSLNRRQRVGLAILALAALGFLAGAACAPWLSHESRWGFLATLVYRPVCHQIPSRCLDLGWGPMAVCARCTGLYLGGILGLLWPPFAGRAPRPTLRLLIAIAAPSCLDFGLGLVGLPSLPNLPRLLLALPLGAVLGLLLAAGAAELLAGDPRNRRSSDLVQ